MAGQAVGDADSEVQILTESELRQRERANISAALNKCGWRIYGPGGAAELLRINASTLALPGKPMVVGSLDDPNSKREFQLEVTVTKLK